MSTFLENNNSPIGVYDSGMGGLIVLETLIEQFPNEDFIFIADNANFPYGTKTSEQIEEINLNIYNYLKSQNCKAVCIACNTASANSSLLDKLAEIPIIKTIEPTVKLIKENINKDKNNILVIATNLTIKTKIYEQELDKYLLNFPHHYYALATQNFVDIVEEGRYGTINSFEEVKETLKDYLDKDIDKIILGCTHFSKLKPEIKILFPNAYIYSSEKAMAKELKNELINNLNKETNKQNIILITTGDLDLFINQTKWFKYKEKAIYKSIKI